MINLFIALSFNSIVIEALQRLESDFRHNVDCSALKFEDISKYHLTLRYLGSVTDIHMLTKCLREVKQKAFTLQLSDVDIFSCSEPNVLWVGVQGNTTQLNNLKLQIDKIAEQLEVVEQPAEFRPHITMAYSNKELLPYEAALTQFRPDQVCFEVTDFHLLSVTDRYTEACFRKLETFTLIK